MSRVWVSNDADTVRAEVVVDDEEGGASAACPLGDWATDPNRFDVAGYVIDQAGTHMDLHH